MSDEQNNTAMRLCDELIRAAYEGDIYSPSDLASRIREIKKAINGPTPGNAFEMREALEALIAYWDWNGFDALRESQLKDMARAALAKPPRNCDRFANVESAIAAFHVETGIREKPLALWLGHDIEEFAAWLLVPAEGGAE